MSPDDPLLYRVLREAQRIAVVGCSSDPLKPGSFVPEYLLREGYQIWPVNPNHESLLGVRCARSLLDVETRVDVVEVFRPEDEAPEIAAQAAAIGARCLWLQLGIASNEAARIARAAGVVPVMNECMGVAHGRVGLGPGVSPPVPVPELAT